MSAPIVRPDQNDARPGHIHNTGQASSAHHARFQLPGGNCSPVYGPDSFARHSRGGVAVGERTGHLASPDFCGCRIRWSSPSALQPAKQPRGGISKWFHLLLSLLAHGFNHGERNEQGVVRQGQGQRYE
jgi:hypothetical protein